MHRFVLPIIAVLAFIAEAHAKITAKVTLEQLVKDQPLIFTVKVSDFLPDKPGMVLTPVDKLRGEFPFERIPVNLTGDKEAIDEKQPAIVLDRLDKDLTLVIFAARRGKVFDAVAYTNGTWIRLTGVVDKQDGNEVTRWRFLHCETYFRRTFKGTTEELLKAVQGGLKGEKLPPYNDKEEPGYGPPLKKSDKKPLAAGFAPLSPLRGEGLGERGIRAGAQTPPPNPLPASGRGSNSPLRTSLPFGVIQIPFLGLIAALAALFPAVFGGAAIFMRRWVAALSIASFASILSALVVFFPNWIGWTGLKTISSVWLTAAVIAALGALWADYRYRRAMREDRGDEFQPRFADRIGLAVLLLLAVAGLAVAVALKEPLRNSPWLELILFAVPASACLYFVVAHWLRTKDEPKPVALSAETVGLWAGSFACAVAGVALLAGPRGPAFSAGGGSGTVKLVEQPLWVFEPKEKGEIVSTPCVTPERIYVTVHHRPNPVSQYGRVYALDPATGNVLWDFDDEGALKPLFCSPAYADGRLYFGEGYHTDRDSKLFCVDSATGKKLWDFQTNSHTESTPAVADGKVVFGAGDDGMYCLNATTGDKLWQFPTDGSLHIDSNPLIYGGKIYAGSGTSKRSKNTRIFCVDLQTGMEMWGEKVDYSAWGSPTVADKQVFFATGNGTYSEDRAPIAGLVICRDAATGKPIWERALANSVVCKPAVDRYQVYVGCRDGNCYALDRYTGEVIWSKTLQSPVLASPTIDANPQLRTGEVLYAIGSMGQMEALSPTDGTLFWSISFRDLVEMPYVDAVSTPVVVREMRDGKIVRRVYIGLGFGPSQAATPTARLYCFLNTNTTD